MADDMFVQKNTIQDLRYMKKLRDTLDDPLTSSGTREKIIAEIAVTLPTKDELLSFFRDQELRTYVSTLLET